MTSIEHLSLAKLRGPINSYRNLFYYRTVIVEGIRQIAFRNMAHLTHAMARPPRLSSVAGDDWIAEVQRRMLHDQGMDDTSLNRTLIAWATYHPLQVYLALLYAQVEFYRNCCRGTPILDDSSFTAYLDGRGEFVEKLRPFRHFFLHPSKDSAPSELGFLSVRGSYNLAPEIQSKLDEYLHDMRGRLLGELLGMLSDLPDVQRLYCLSRFLPENLIRMLEHSDLQGQEHVQGQMAELMASWAQLGDEATSWLRSPVQEEKAAILAGYLNDLSPSIPEQTYTDLPPHQTPMSMLTLSSLIAGLAPDSYGSGRYAAHVQRNIGELRRVIIAGGVLLNELVTGRGRFTPQYLKDLASTMSRGDFANLLYGDLFSDGLQHADEQVSLGRVSAALLYEPLRLYRKLIEETPGMSRPGLDEITDPPALAALAIHRNSVFHVCEPRQDPRHADLAVARPALLEAVSRLHPELSAFFGVASGDLPSSS